MSLWDDKEVVSSGNFVKFDNVGDGVSGTITALTKHTFDDGKVAPKLEITQDDGEEVTLTAGQVRLKNALAEERPEVGDHISIKFTQNESRGGGKTLKHFEVAVVRGNGAAPAAAAQAAVTAQAAAAAAPAAVDPAAVMALAQQLQAAQGTPAPAAG